MPANNFQLMNITFFSDGLALKGTLHLPPSDKPPVVIGLHGLYSSQESPKQIALAQACNALDLAYFRFDHRGCGRSQGEFEKVTSLAARCRDLKRAVETVRGWPDCGKHIGLFGSSMGGTVSLRMAADLFIDSIVTFAAPLRSRIHFLAGNRKAEPKDTAIYLDPDKNDFDISSYLPHIANILIIHGDADETVPVSHAKEIYSLAAKPKKLIIQHNGDHRMSNKRHQDDFIREAASWLKSGLLNPNVASLG
jgi:alpha-beta hydrolase superfamily lysophospholipase